MRDVQWLDRKEICCNVTKWLWHVICYFQRIGTIGIAHTNEDLLSRTIMICDLRRPIYSIHKGRALDMRRQYIHEEHTLELGLRKWASHRAPYIKFPGAAAYQWTIEGSPQTSQRRKSTSPTELSLPAYCHAPPETQKVVLSRVSKSMVHKDTWLNTIYM